MTSHPLEESEAQRNGEDYIAANGERIESEGQKILTLAATKGVVGQMTFQVVKVAKALGSVSKIYQAGHRVVFNPEGSYIQDKGSGEVMWLEEKNGLCVLPAKYAPPGWKPQDGGPPSSFPRPGRHQAINP